MADLGPKLRVLRCGGETRAQSVANGLRAMASELGGEAEIGELHGWGLGHEPWFAASCRPWRALQSEGARASKVSESTAPR